MTLLEKIDNDNLQMMKDSIAAICVNGLSDYTSEYKMLFDKTQELGMSPHVFETYETDLFQGIPYLSTCFIMYRTPINSTVSVDTLVLDQTTDMAYFEQPCRYIRSIKVECKRLRIQHFYFTWMGEHKKHYSPSICSSATSLTVLIKSNDKYEHKLLNSLKWTLETQLTLVNEVIFRYDGPPDLSMLEYLL